MSQYNALFSIDLLADDSLLAFLDLKVLDRIFQNNEAACNVPRCAFLTVNIRLVLSFGCTICIFNIALVLI